MLKGFRDFILRGNVVDLAVGVVVGAAFNSVVSSLVKDLLTPMVAAVFKSSDFTNLYFTIHRSKFMYGDLINSIISFLLIAVTVYFFVVVPVNTIMAKFKGPAAPTTKKCPECLSDIPVAAKRCSQCTQLISD